MNFGLVDFLTLLGSLGFFIYGMKIMSEGIQKVAGSRMRQILRAMTSNRFLGVFTGFLITSLVQSSSATTVMVVSFVNAGLLSLIESIGVIMGANIGTTVTAWIISIVGFKIKIGAAALPLIAFGFPLIFSSRSRVKSWGEVIIGFALLFMGLDLLKGAVPDIKSNPEILAFLSNYTDLGFVTIILFVIIGTILTVVIQSSSATMALTLVMANEGWITFDIAAAMVMGENIGTTITANLAALIANVNAKRAARAHFIFNIFGVIWMLLLMPVFINAIDSYMSSTSSGSPLENAVAIPVALSIFHTSFNVLNVLLLIGFTKFIASVVTKMVKEKSEESEFKLEYISNPMLNMADVNLEEVAKELQKFAEITSRMNGFTRDLIFTKRSGRNAILKRIKKYEDITDRFEIEIAQFLTRVSTEDLTDSSSARLRGILSASGTLEQIGDHYYQLSLQIEKKSESGQWFTQPQVDYIKAMLDVLDEAFEKLMINLKAMPEDIDIEAVQQLDSVLNDLRDTAHQDHLRSIQSNDYDIYNGLIYGDVYDILEQVGDRLVDISRGIRGDYIKDEEDR